MPLLLLLLLRPAVGDLLSWGPGMARLVAMEGELVAEARRHADHLEAALTAVEEYVREVHQVYGGCPGGACDEETMMERVLGNPIYNYQLLKRVTVYWANVEKAISRVDREDTLSRIRKIKRWEVRSEQPFARRTRELPTESDLQSAARSITYLAEVRTAPPPLSRCTPSPPGRWCRAASSATPPGRASPLGTPTTSPATPRCRATMSWRLAWLRQP